MRADPSFRFAVILGTNEIASAIAVRLHQNGFRIVLSHDPLPPVIRRKMAFHDALFDDDVTLDGIAARRADTGLEIRTGLAQASSVAITELGLLDLIVVRAIDILVDARMQKYLATPDLRRLGRLAIGLGPGFAGGANCDIAIETRPGRWGLAPARRSCRRTLRARRFRRKVEHRNRNRYAGLQEFHRRPSGKRTGARAVRRDIARDRS